MPEKIQPRLPAGMRDILPEQMIKRQYVLDTVRSVFEEFGFEPLQTPALELSETLLGKYGEDAERLIFKSWYGDTPGGDLSLRYDLSVPLCRVVGMYPDIPRPFKRYQIAPVWRADRPQKGRYREFYQCDVDIVGSDSMLADAEIVCVMVAVFKRLGFNEVTIAINNRKLLDGIGQYAGVPADLQAGLYRSIDKLDKIGAEGVRRELLMVGVPANIVQPIQRVARLAIQGKLALDDLGQKLAEAEEYSFDAGFVETLVGPLRSLVEEAIAQKTPSGELQALTASLAGALATQIRAALKGSAEIIPEDVVTRLLDLLQLSGPPAQILDGLGERLKGIPRAEEGIGELRDLFRYLAAQDVPEDVYRLNFAMVRGLEYYTGPIFETTVEKPKAMPSITGGGRFDNLIGMFSPVSYPATGTSLGIERIIDVMDELGMFPPDLGATTAQALVTVFSAETAEASLGVAGLLREAGVKTAVYFGETTGLRDQIGYASAKGIPFVIVLGPDEVANNTVTIRRLGATAKDSEQRTVSRADMARSLREW